ncbi:quinol:cytochrome C oxidoreductase [Acidobacteria bacterium AH-259-G07]|nr:quinol:cytochrome C oxidoreductase [Acidobacteria bacterium AH-259-G07]
MEKAQKLVMVGSEGISISQGHPWSRSPGVAAGVGLVGLVVSIVVGLGDLRQLWHSYLVSCLFYLSLGLGALFFVLVQFVSRAGWSVVVRRLAEQVMGTLPVVAVFFLPLALGLQELYPWSRTEVVAQDALLQYKRPYLNPSFFYLRSLVYLISWSIMAWWFRHRSLQQDEVGDLTITRRLQTASAPALVWFGVTVTFAAFDWIMSLDPYWYSTIFGVYFFSGCVVAGLAFLVLIALWLQREALSRVVSFEHFHGLGKLLFGFMVFWAYIAFSQFLLIWYANIPEETVWYAQRLTHGWWWVTAFLALGHFVLPFFFLLPREVKRKRVTLVTAGVWLLAMHYLDLYWLVMPNLHPEGFHPHLLDATTWIALGGLFLGFLGISMRHSALVPIRDPRLAESLSFENR